MLENLIVQYIQPLRSEGTLVLCLLLGISQLDWLDCPGCDILMEQRVEEDLLSDTSLLWIFVGPIKT